MSLKTSFNVKYGTRRTLFLNFLRRFFWMPIVHTLLLGLVGSLSLSDFRIARMNEGVHAGGTSLSLMEYFTRYIVDDGTIEIPIILTLMASAFLGCFVMAHTYGVPSTGFTHSMPVKRREVYFSNLLCGFLLLAVPNVLFTVYAFALGVRWDAALVMLAFLLLYTAVMFTGSVCAALFSGNIIGGGCCVIAAFVTPYLIEGFIRELMDRCLRGYCSSYSDLFVTNWFYISVRDILDAPAKVLLYLAFTAVFILLGLFLLNKRDLENAGDLIVFPVLRAPTLFFGGLFVGICAYFIFGNGIVAFLLMGLAALLLLNFPIRKKFTLKGAVGAAIAFVCVSAITAAIFAFDLFGFERYVPKLADIEYAVVDDRYAYNHSFDNDFDGWVVDDPDYLDSNSSRYTTDVERRYYREDYSEYQVTDTTDIAKITELHRALTGLRNDRCSPFDAGRTMVIYYKLKNGRLVKREYIIYRDADAEIFKPVADIRKVRATDQALLCSDVVPTYIEVTGIYGKKVTIAEKDLEKVFAALQTDLAEGDFQKQGLFFGSSRNTTLSDLTVKLYRKNIVYTDDGSPVPEAIAKAQTYRIESFYIGRNKPHTKEVLNELGYGDLFDESADLPDGSYAEFSVYEGDLYPEGIAVEYDYDVYPTVETREVLNGSRVTDKECIKALICLLEDDTLDEDAPYETWVNVYFRFPYDESFDDNLKYRGEYAQKALELCAAYAKGEGKTAE